VAPDGSSPEQVREQIREEREELVRAVESLRSDLRLRLPRLAAGALGAGFVLAGGLGAAVRLLFRR
jgi:hypothetical protein